MADGIRAPLLNPVLSLLQKPTPQAISGGGKNAKGIVGARLERQKEKLSSELLRVDKDKSVVEYSGKIHLLVKMFDDSLAPSWTPDDLFETNNLTRIVSPAYNGYLVEISKSKIPEIINRIRSAASDKIKVDVSRLESIKGFNKDAILRGKQEKDVYDSLSGGSKQFNVWILPFHDSKARVAITEKLEELVSNKSISFGNSEFENVFDEAERKEKNSSSFANKLKKYLSSGTLSFTAVVNDGNGFNKLLSSGAVYRIEPVSPIFSKSTPPGVGSEPSPKLINAEGIPTVVIIDGGCSATSYQTLNVMNIKPLVSTANADVKHGNKITSIICQGAAWNNNLALPSLECKFISVQAINKKDVDKQPTTEQFINYLWGVARKTKGVASVWNLSFNEKEPFYSSDEISFLGHEINKIAREFSILPIISIGNVSEKNKSRLCPPADCEAALTISGRQANHDGTAHTPCSFSLRGPAPGGMKKPELSWFSTLRVLGGDIDTGTSFSAPLISSISAHAFQNLKDASPDLVKALLINKAERYDHDLRLGWGSPWKKGDSLPWLCDVGTVTLVWTSKLQAGFAYYWNDIPLPPEMLVGDKIKGEITLTAILKPLVSELGGENYFSTRLQCALQSVGADGKVKNLLGSMKESKEKELQSRHELAKWSPVRHHGKVFSGVAVDNKKLRLYTRVFTRDLYQFGLATHHELDEQEVAFALTFKTHDNSPSVYNSMKQNLGTNVEIGTVDQQVDLDNLI